MTSDPAAQLRRYFAAVDESQAAIDFTEVAERGSSVRVTNLLEPATRRPAFIAGLAGLATAVALGVVLLTVRPFGTGDTATGNDTTGFFDEGTAPSTTAVPPTTSSPVTTSGVPGVSRVPGSWCGVGSPLERLNFPADESVAWAAVDDVAWDADGSEWEIGALEIGAFPPTRPDFEFRQTLPDGSVVQHPLPAIEDFDLPPWALQGLEGVGDLGPFDLEVTTDGQVWLSKLVWLSNNTRSGWNPSPYGVLRYDPVSSTWENIEMVPGRTVPVAGIEATCDGSLWSLVIDWTMGDDRVVLEGWWLAHIDTNEVITRIDVDLPPGTVPEAALRCSWSSCVEFQEPVDGPPVVILADDRAVWVTNGLGSPTLGSFVFSGVARYDGEEWTRFLDGELVRWLTLNDDGTATAELEPPSGPPELVLIEP